MAPTAPDPRRERALASAREALAAGAVDRCIAACRELHERSEPTAASLALLGEAQLRRGDRSRALRSLRRAVDLDPDPELAASYARALRVAGRDDEARAVFDTILRHYPKHRAACAERGRRALAERRWTAARMDLERAVAAAADDAGLWNDLGIAQRRCGAVDDAAESYRRAFRLQPSAPIGHNLAALLNQRGEHRAAVGVLERALEDDPTHVASWNGLGIACQELGRLDQALAHFQRALSLGGDRSELWANVGDTLLKAGRFDAAVEPIERALALAPDNTGARALHYLRRLVEASAGEVEGFLERAVRPFTLDAPDGSSRAAIDRGLCDYIAGHRTLTREPAGLTTRRGSQTREISRDPHPALDHLRGFTRDCLVDYFEVAPAMASSWPGPRSGGDPRGPVPTPPETWRLSMWGTVFEETGALAPHIHTAGVLSGVYYPLAEDLGEPPGCEGWFEVGVVPDSYPIEPRATRRLRPAAGLAFIFPSFLYHRTIPQKSAGTRLSIAFDLLRDDTNSEL